jgi:hypothetical protein
LIALGKATSEIYPRRGWGGNFVDIEFTETRVLDDRIEPEQLKADVPDVMSWDNIQRSGCQVPPQHENEWNAFVKNKWRGHPHDTIDPDEAGEEGEGEEPDAPPEPAEGAPTDEGSGETDGRQQAVNQERKVAVEKYAMLKARQYLRKRRYRVKDVSAKKSWDFEAERHGITLHIEVKGSSTTAAGINVTAHEVTNAQSSQRVDLIVVDNIDCDSEYNCSGGSRRVIEDWRPAREDLTPTQYTYRLPPEPDREEL